jgi:light-regulated signal transduction histidine kinase (bacteriophytochrome)
MAIHTSALFAILSLGILHARPDRGVMRAVASDGPGGTMARTLLPAVLLGPPVLGWLRVLGQEHGLYDTAQGTGLLVAATITLGMLLIVVNARALDRKEAERRRIQAALEERAQELERSNQELEHFAYVASHDLQEPLRIVASYAQLLQRRYASRLGQDADEFIQFIVDGANRMQQLILDLLSFSRIGTRGRRFEAVECETVLSEAVENLRAAVLESGASITHDPLPAVTADPTQLTQLFQNLLGNALKFRNAEPPRVHVSAERGESEWTFRVRDNGIGIAPEHRDRIFRMFQRLHTREQYPGTGIGLSLCKKVVERHGGKIWVEPAPGKGSIFCFTLPALGGNA